MSLFLKWEAEAFGDIHMIDMQENMDDGKTFEYFADLANMYPSTMDETMRPWDYAMKLDDDAFLNIPNLLERLRPMVPRRSTWFVQPQIGIINASRVAEGSRSTSCMGQDISCHGI
jgi:hypothetical protein